MHRLALRSIAPVIALLVAALLCSAPQEALAQSSSAPASVPFGGSYSGVEPARLQEVLTQDDPSFAGLVEPSAGDANGDLDFILGGPERWTSEEGLSSSLQIVLLLTVLSLAPAVFLMTTSFVRIVIVLGMLRQAIGTNQLPPSQVVTALAIFMTVLLMMPAWTDVYQEAVKPYTQKEISLDEAWTRGTRPIRAFMSRQIEASGNAQDIWLFYEYLPEGTPEPETFDDVPLHVLVPAFMLSELKISFLIGFQIYLPFLILDMVVASVTLSMGMMMLPPSMMSLPLKIMLFVLVDGWNLVVGMLLHSFAPYS